MKFPTIPILLSIAFHCRCEASPVQINEVAYKGSSNTCNGEDWIELVVSSSTQDLLNYTLHDDKGKDDNKAKYFNESMIINAGGYLVLCRNVDFDFGIGGDDVVTLLDNNGAIVSEVMLLGSSEDNQTFAFFDSEDVNEEEGKYKYTAMPTPGKANIYVTPKPLEVKLAEQNEEGDDFFLEKESDGAVIFDKVVDLHVKLSNESLATIVNHPTWEEFVPFVDVAVSNPSGNTTIISSSGTGKIRTKGQSTLMITACLGLQNVPFQIEFDKPFMGMEVMYLRNHMGDMSYMRDYASHFMLRRFGLPYLRSRPVRLYMNGEYVGFYTLMEAPAQGYVMQRSFGVFQPQDTALYKIKTQVAQCPVTDPVAIASKSEEPPNPYYFDRGNHREGVPPNEGESVEERIYTCLGYFREEIMKEGADLVQGILHFNNSCGTALVSLGRVDRDYGPMSTVDAMINFADSVMFNKTLSDIKPFIDADQWIKNFAAYAVTLNQDSVINNVNNWYLGTVDNGASWRIVQYDHNSIATRGGMELCGPGCSNRMIYHPILRPSCKSVEDHIILGRVLNDEKSWETYLKYVEEFVGVVESSIADLRAYGHDIKMYLVDDALAADQTVESYEESELGLDYSDYNTASNPLLKILSARLVEIKAQLDSIRNGTMPREGKYGENEKCPDWRDDDGSDYIAGSTYDEDSCTIPIPECELAAPCYENSPQTCSKGELVPEECKKASPFCDSCYPASSCGGSKDESGKFVESENCGPEFYECSLGSACFDHKSGICAYDGSILIEECKEAELYCKQCYPLSRCGTGTLEEGDEEDEGSLKDESGKFVESDSCGPEFAGCSLGALCFDHILGLCAEDGSISVEECKEAELFCKPCFPYSRCGTLDLGSTEEDREEATDGDSTPDEEPFEDENEDVPSSAYKASIIIAFICISFSLLSCVQY